MASEGAGDYAAELKGLFARNLRRARTALGLSQRGLARAVGVPQHAISRLEAGSNNPTISTMARLAEGVSAEVPALLSKREAE
jgi:transcriptional regulator with XRE-family HTH domain